MVLPIMFAHSVGSRRRIRIERRRWSCGEVLTYGLFLGGLVIMLFQTSWVLVSEVSPKDVAPKEVSPTPQEIPTANATLFSQEKIVGLMGYYLAEADTGITKLLAETNGGAVASLASDPQWLARLSSARMPLRQSESAQIGIALGDILYSACTAPGLTIDGPSGEQQLAFLVESYKPFDRDLPVILPLDMAEAQSGLCVDGGDVLWVDTILSPSYTSKAQLEPTRLVAEASAMAVNAPTSIAARLHFAQPGVYGVRIGVPSTDGDPSVLTEGKLFTILVPPAYYQVNTAGEVRRYALSFTP